MNTQAVEVRTVQYMLRRNLGNYEHEEITLSGQVKDGADPMYAVDHLKALAKFALYAESEVKQEAIAQVLKTPVVAESPKKGLVEHKVKLADSPKAEATFVKGADEPAPTYAQADGSVSTVPGEIPPPIPQEALTKEEPKAKRTRTTKPKAEPKEEMEEVESPYKAHPSEKKSEEPKEEVKAEVVAGEEKVKKNKATPHISYDRNVKEHRSTLATYLNTNHKGWQTKKPQDEIVKFSSDLHGKEFMDTKGNILDSFKTELSGFFG